MISSVDLTTTSDPRPDMDYDVSIPVLGLARCSVSSCYAAGPQPGVMITRHRHHGKELGQLYLRCPDHQAAWEARRTAPDRRRRVAG